MKGQRSSQKVSHMYGTLSCALLCVVFVSHGLLVWGHDPWLSDDDATENYGEDDEFIDFTDMVNYDPVTKRMVNRKEKEPVQPKCACDCDEYQKTLDQCSVDLEASNKAKSKCEAESPPVDSGPKEPCSGEEMFFRRFARQIVDKLAEQVGEDGDINVRMNINLSPSSWRKLQDFVYNKKGRMAEAYDELTEMIGYVDSVNATTFAMWMEDVLQLDRSYLKFAFWVIILAVIFVMFEMRTTITWLQQLGTVTIVFIIISLFWNWLYLYKKEVANRMSLLNREPPEHCMTGKMNLWDTFSEAMRSRFTFNQDPCKLYNEQILVDPIYEVPPTKAIAHTFATLFLEPLKYLGKAVAEFNHELFANLPLQAWIPALLSVYGGIAVAVIMCMRYSWNYRREPRVIYQQLPAPPAQQLLPARDQLPRIEDVPFQPQDPEPEAKSFQQPIALEPATDQDVRRRPPRHSTSRQRKTSERQASSNGQPELEASIGQSKESAFQTITRGRSDSTDSEDINILKQGDEGGKSRRRPRKRSVSPPKLDTKLATAERTTTDPTRKSDGGSPMMHPESELSSAEPASLMQSVDSSTLLVASTRHMPPPANLGDMGESQQIRLQQEGSHSSDGSTPTLSPLQCNTPSSVSVLGDEASSDDMTQDSRPALERVHLSVSGELEPELLGAEGGSTSAREGSNEDDDDFEVLHKEQLPQPE